MVIQFYRKHRHRYRHKAEVKESRERMRERRMILSMVKARYVEQSDSDGQDYDRTYITCTGISKPTMYDTSNNVANL